VTAKEFFKEVGSSALNGMAGASYVQQWRDYRAEAACKAIDNVVRVAFRDRNEKILGAILNAFGNEIRDAGTPETQNHLNDLLLYFKDRVAQSLNAAAATNSH
jgi:hypothetical protein